MESVFLIELSDQFIINLTCNILKENNIPFHLKHKGLGAYNRVTMGWSIYGAEFFVNKSDYDKALELLETINKPSDEPSDFTSLKDSDNKTYFISKIIIRFFILLIGLVSAILIIVSFIQNITSSSYTKTTYTTTYSRTVSSRG